MIEDIKKGSKMQEDNFSKSIDQLNKANSGVQFDALKANEKIRLID